MSMTPMDKELLEAIHRVDKNVTAKLVELETKIDDSVSGRFKDVERRVTNVENTISKLVWLVIAAIVGAIMTAILK